jgi:hypothetical protein
MTAKLEQPVTATNSHVSCLERGMTEPYNGRAVSFRSEGQGSPGENLQVFSVLH